jgi:hypothetical protein
MPGAYSSTAPPVFAGAPSAPMTSPSAHGAPAGPGARGVLATGGPEARLLLQRLLSGSRVAREPFRTPGRRGYRFRATGSYAAVLANSNDIRIPLGQPR